MIYRNTLALLNEQLSELEKALEKTPEYQRVKEKKMAIEYVESLQKREIGGQPQKEKQND